MNAAETSPPKVSAALAHLVALAQTPRTTRPEERARVREAIEAHAASPRSVGLIDRHTLALLDALDAIADAQKADNERTARIWRQVAGVLLPDVQADLLAAMHTEAGH